MMSSSKSRACCVRLDTTALPRCWDVPAFLATSITTVTYYRQTKNKLKS